MCARPLCTMLLLLLVRCNAWWKFEVSDSKVMPVLVFLQLLVSLLPSFLVVLVVSSSGVTGWWFELHAWLREPQRSPFICLCVCDDCCVPENPDPRSAVPLHSFLQPPSFLSTNNKPGLGKKSILKSKF